MTAARRMLCGLRNSDQKPRSIRSNRCQIGSTSPRPINDQELLFHEKAVGDDRPGTARAKQFGECCQQVCKRQQQVLHGRVG